MLTSDADRPMGRDRHGLVIGKFYPPHAGHHLLIREAAAACDRVTVVVMASSVESIPLADRVAWISETHPDEAVSVVGVTDDLPVDFASAEIWAAHVALMEAAIGRDVTLRGLPADAAKVDLVATSEPYGAELARRFGAEHLCVDPVRGREPVSGTAVRADLAAHWDRLAPATRAGLAWRVVVLGAESTGTTTLSTALADAFRARGGVWARTRWVPEYGREMTEGKLACARVHAASAGRPDPTVNDLLWPPEDFPAIARRQLANEDAAARTGSPLLVCDTDAFATSVWYTRYVGGRHPEVEAVARSRHHHLYLLTDHVGVPFEQDGMRDGEHLREWMTGEFVARLEETGRPWIRLTGDRETRLAAAVAACDRLIAGGHDGPRFAHPLT